MATLYAAKVTDVDVKTPKEKKPRTEKQIASLAKATATRKRKLEEADKQTQLDITAKSEELERVNQQLAEATEKKRLASEKRKATLAAKKAASPKVDSPKPVLEEVKKVDEEVPPPWFKKFIQTGIQQRNTVNDVKQHAKSVRIEAKELADEKWSQPKVRELVNRNMETHYDKMYNQIFCGRGVVRG